MQLRRTLVTTTAAIMVLGLASATGVPATAAPTPVQPKWAAADRTGTVRLHGQVPLSVARAVAGRHSVAVLSSAHPARSSLTLNFALPLRHRAALDALIKTEAKTHRYPSRAQLYARFSPPKAQVAALRHWLTSNGFTVTHVSRDRTAVAASASTATVERTLGTQVRDFVRTAYVYQGVKVPTYRFYSNTADARVPARLGVQSISGLTDIDRFFTDQQLAKGARHGHAAGPDVKTVRSGGYYPSDLRSMYDVSGHGLDATRQTIGFTLWGAGERQPAMDSFASTTGDTPITVDTPCVASGNSPGSPSNCITDQPAPNHLESVLENGNTNGSTGTFEFGGNVETALDIEQAHGIATGAAMKYYLSDCTANPPTGSGLTNGTCNGTDVGMEEAIEDAANDPTLHTVSDSWGYGGDTEWGDNDPFKLASETSFALGAAAGTTFWFSTGDDGTYESGYPADSPYVTAVGGTSLYATTDPGTRSTSTTWSGGGSWCSNLEPRPSWQDIPAVADTASCPGRVVPDVSAVADPNTGVRYVNSTNATGGTHAGQVGGTSLAAPVMNGLEAMTEAFVAQQTYPGQTPPLGFEAPMLYQLGTSSHYGAYFHDVVCGNTAFPTGGPDGDAAGSGWDPATGFGEIDWFNYATGYAIALGATNLSQPASIATNYSYTCAQTPDNASERALSLPTKSVGYSVGAASSSTPWPATFLSRSAWGASNNILKTTDGGATWQPTNSDMMSIACTGASTCTEVGDGGRIRRTTDGGSTWSYVSSPDNKALTSIACPSASVCYAAGDRGAVLKSTDGGATWAYVNTADGNPIYGLSCPSTSICYAVDNYAHVEKTLNGGNSWTLMSTPVTTPGVNVPGSGGPNPFAGLFGITCTTINSCVAVGGFPQTGTDPPIVTTTDGGNTWTLRTSNAAGNLEGVACSGTTCYADGGAGSIVTSTDGGATWSAMSSNTTAQLMGIACVSATSCAATGQSGTVDVLSGGTWTPTTAQANSLFLASVVCRSATDCVAAGKQGATLAFDSTNVAGSATLQAGGGTTAQLNSISCDDAMDCVGVGNAVSGAGTILTTSNGGQTWLPRVSNETVSLNGVSCINSTCEAVGAATGGAAVIVRSTDGGVTWSPQTSNSTASLTGVTCLSDTRCVAVGSTGTIVTTTDGGITWTPATGTGTVSLAAVACSGSNCYAVGSLVSGMATLLASTDKGATWSAQTSNSAQALTSIACTNDVACFAGGSLGTIVTTVDGGATWAQQGNPLSGPTSALNAGPSGTAPINGATCTSSACVFGTSSAGNIMTTPLLTVTVTASGKFGDSPPLTGLSPDDPSISYSPMSGAGNVTGTLTCSTTATATSDPDSYPVSECSGLADPGFSVVYDLDDSSYTIGQADQTINFPAIPDMTYGDAPFTPNASATSGLTVTFQVSGDCQLNDQGEVVITGAGSCTVTASQDGNADFNAADDVSHQFDIAKADQTIMFGTLDPHTFGDASFEIDPTASSELPVSLVATGSCSVDSDTAPANVTITGGGSCQITASQDGNENYNAADDVTRSFDIAKADQTITFDALPDRTFNDAPFDLGATASSGLDVSYQASGQCTVDGNEVTITGAGDCSITASQIGDDNYNPAPDVTQMFHIAKDSQTITFAKPDDTTLDGGPVTVSATSTSGLTVLFSVSGDCTINGDQVTLTDVGSCTVTASQSGDSDYLAADDVVRTFNITKGAQTITFAPLANHQLGTGPFVLSASASSGLAVTFSAADGSACTVLGTTVTLTGAGTCTVDADQAGNDDWNAAATVTRAFTVTKANPVVEISTSDQHPKFGNETVQVSVLATAAPTPSGSVRAVSSQGESCKIAALTAAGTGSCRLLLMGGSVTIVANYHGDANYAASTGSVTVQVAKFKPTVTLSTSVSSASGGKHTVKVHVSLHGTANTPPTGKVAVSDGSGESCTIHLASGAGNCSLVVRNGKYTITAQYNGDTNYAAVTATTKVKLN